MKKIISILIYTFVILTLVSALVFIFNKEVVNLINQGKNNELGVLSILIFAVLTIILSYSKIKDKLKEIKELKEKTKEPKVLERLRVKSEVELPKVYCTSCAYYNFIKTMVEMTRDKKPRDQLEKVESEFWDAIINKYLEEEKPN